MTIEKPFRGHGYGRQLLNILIARLQKQEISTLELVVLGGESNVEMMGLINKMPIIEKCNNLYQLQLI